MRDSGATGAESAAGGADAEGVKNSHQSAMRLSISAVGLSVLLAVPASGDQLVSVNEEIALGKQAQGQVKKEVPELTDRQVAGYVQSIGRQLVARAGGPKYPYTFSVANYREINAFALPGGPVWIHRGSDRGGAERGTARWRAGARGRAHRRAARCRSDDEEPRRQRTARPAGRDARQRWQRACRANRRAGPGGWLHAQVQPRRRARRRPGRRPHHASGWLGSA